MYKLRTVYILLECFMHCDSCPIINQNIYRITGIIRRRKVSRIAFFAVVCKKTFAIQAISYIKILAEIKVQENICECFQIREIRETFLPWMIPIIRYFRCKSNQFFDKNQQTITHKSMVICTNLPQFYNYPTAVI